MAGPVLEARNLSGPLDTDRVRGVSMAIEPGQVWHVHGASGSGKTTLLRLLSRLDPAEHGTLLLDGANAATIALPEWRRRVSLVFQDSRLFAGTVADNVTWGARTHGLNIDVASALARVGLDVDPGRAASALSGGEAKRLAVARALAVQPRVLLLDEPTAALDAPSRRPLRRLVRHVATTSCPVVVVSHIAEDLNSMPGPALLIDQGAVRRQTDSRELYRQVCEDDPEAI